MAKPPNTPPNSDIDGVDEDEHRNADAATEADQSGKDLARAKKQSKGRPPYADDVEDRDDRTGGA